MTTTCVTVTPSASSTVTILAAPPSGTVYVLDSWSWGSLSSLETIGPVSGNAPYFGVAITAGGSQSLESVSTTGATFVENFGSGADPTALCYESIPAPSSTPGSDALTAATGALATLGPGEVQIAGSFLVLAIVAVVILWVFRRIQG